MKYIYDLICTSGIVSYTSTKYFATTNIKTAIHVISIKKKCVKIGEYQIAITGNKNASNDDDDDPLCV